MSLKEVYFEGPPPWGFRMTGGVDTGHSLRISRVNPGSRAEAKGVREGDLITSINGQSTKCLTNSESHALLRSIKENLQLGLNEDKPSSPKRRSKEIKLTPPSATAGDKGDSTGESKEPTKRKQNKSRHTKKRTFKRAIKSLLGYRETEGQIINLHPPINGRKSEECDSIDASTLPDDNTSRVYYDNLREDLIVNDGEPSENGSTQGINPSYVSKNSDCSEVIRILDTNNEDAPESQNEITPNSSPVKPKTVTFGQNQVCEVSFHHCDLESAALKGPEPELVECTATEVIELPQPDECVSERGDLPKPVSLEPMNIHWPSVIKIVAPPSVHLPADSNYYKQIQSVFMNPRRYLEAISEESSDLSDSGKIRVSRHFEKPINHFNRILDDINGSKEGIDTSWQEGKSLEEVSDVPIVSDSHSDSDVLNEDASAILRTTKKPFKKNTTLPSNAVVKNVVSSYYNSVNPFPSPVHLETVQNPRPLSGPISEVVEIVYVDSSDSEVTSKSEADYCLDALKESDTDDFGNDVVEKISEPADEQKPESYDSRSIPESTVSSSSRATSKFSNVVPLTLRELGVLAVLRMPDGACLLKELGLEYIDTDQYSGYVAECSGNSCSSIQFNSEKDCDIISERDLIFDNFSGSFPWIEELSQETKDMEEEKNSTSSRNSSISDISMKTSKDIACLLDLHGKFAQRRGYFEPENLRKMKTETVEVEFIDPSTALKKYHELRQKRMKMSQNDSEDNDVSLKDSIKEQFKSDNDELVGNSRLLDLIQSLEGKSSNGKRKMDEPVYVNVEYKSPALVSADLPNKSTLLKRRHSEDNINVATLCLPRPDRPKSLPPPGEILRRRMYDEYMDKLAAMSERRQLKVVKLSKCPQDEIIVGHEIGSLEKEFMGKVKERNLKLGIENVETDEDDEHHSGEETPLPRHIQELMEQSVERGIWSPAQTPEAERKKITFADIEIDESKENESHDPQPPVWTPKTVPSPTLERKFRPVNFQSPPPKRKEYNQLGTEKKPELPKDLPIEIDLSNKLNSSVSENSGLSTPLRLPPAQNPTITLLQKAREGEIPKGAHYLEDIPDKPAPKLAPNEIIYSVKKEFTTVDEEGVKKVVELTPRKFVGIGPTTREGIPIGLRSEVKEDNQQKWYKRMYDSLHKADNDKDYVTVRYKTKRKGQYPYSYAGGYASEPERFNYDSDASLSKYATLDRRKIRNKESDFTSSTLPRNKYGPDVKHAVNVYKNQPGRIENYEPGHSSISEIEKKQWWDEVLDIFNGEINQGKHIYSQDLRPYSYKDAGYDSDSTLVFKRRDDMSQTLSPAEQKMAYKVIQRGGEVPLHGLRKSMPDRPKESPHRYVESEVNIHYKTPVRNEAKVAWPEEELAEKQAEIMRRIYQEQRRTKYLNELHDMYSRRHTDNFIPSQKSPIPLNRYDDFPLEPQPPRPRDRTPEPKLVARAMYNFVGQTPKELNFRKGDIIYVRRQIDKNWYEGEHNAMIGLFPFNYVEIIPYDGIRSLPRKASEGQARAKFNFQAQTHLELSLVKGELVLLTRRVDENWFEGRIGNRKGIFPVSYVEVLVEPGERARSPTGPISSKPIVAPASHSVMLNGAKDMGHQHYQPPRPALYSSSSLPSQSRVHDVSMMSQSLHIETQSDPIPYRVLYNYRPQNDDELELKEGDVVYVMEKCDDGWYVGSLHRNGQFGTFPGNYVERITP